MRTRGKVTIVLLVLLLLVGGVTFHYRGYVMQGIRYGFFVKTKNDSYEGTGNQKVKGQDGYTTTFTTYNNKVYKEYKQNGDASWADHEYWEGTMANNGCGITAMSIILSGYGKDVTPEDLREKYAPHLAGENMQSAFQSYGLQCSNFYTSSYMSKEDIIEHLEQDKPVLVCVWAKLGENRWTTNSHYMVLLATDGDLVYVSNPSGHSFYNKSGWYDFDTISSVLAKVMYIRS